MKLPTNIVASFLCAATFTTSSIADSGIYVSTERARAFHQYGMRMSAALYEHGMGESDELARRVHAISESLFTFAAYLDAMANATVAQHQAWERVVRAEIAARKAADICYTDATKFHQHYRDVTKQYQNKLMGESEFDRVLESARLQACNAYENAYTFLITLESKLHLV